MPLSGNLRFRAKVWEYKSGGWYFATLPKAASARIKRDYSLFAGGWGSLPVIARIGDTQWETSIFPDGRRRAYLLPLKASVRKAEKLAAGKSAVVEIEVKRWRPESDAKRR